MQILIRWWLRYWRKGQRAADLKFLWPACKEIALTLDLAKAAFALHVYEDPAWCEELSPRELYDFIENLR